MRSPLATILPLLSAFGYTFAALMLKRASETGAGTWRVTFISNWMGALLFAPWWLLGGHEFTWANLGHAMICAGLFFVGQIFTFLALTRGDVSLTTPVLGTKVIFVALGAVLFAGQELSPGLWAAALLTSVATALLGMGQTVKRERLWQSLGLGFAAAALFAACDVLMQDWVPLWGFGRFVPVMFLCTAFCSLSLIPFFTAPLRALPGLSLRWALGGGAMLAVQATGLAYAISTFHEVTTSNILYNTRGIWSVIIVWVVGHWFGNTEHQLGTRVLLRRLCGALLLLGAVFMSLKHS